MGATQTRPHVRWMIRRDMAEVLAIESDVFDSPWCEEDFLKCLRQRNCIGMVAEREDLVAGYMVYELHKSQLEVLNFAVKVARQRTGVGRRMIDKLIGKLSLQRRNKIVTQVRESNLLAQLFLRSMGFRASDVIRNFYDDTDEDTYQLVYRYRQEEHDAQLNSKAGRMDCDR